MYFLDSTILLIVPALFFAIYAGYKVKSTFASFSRIRTDRGYTGFDAASKILQSNPATAGMRIELVPGSMTDHYSPEERVLRLSESVIRSSSIAAVGVAAHEAGHALQHAENYFPMQIRSYFVPVASFGSALSFPLFFLGMVFSFKGLIDLGIILFSAAVIFHIVTLPVEFNASSRAINLLREKGIVNRQELAGAKEVLDAAALTYVASAAMAVLQLLRMLMIRRSS